MRREQGLAVAYAVCCRIGVGLHFRLRGVVLQIGLREAVTVDFTPIPVCHSQLVALRLRLRGRDQLVGGVVGEALHKVLVLQPWVGGGYLGHVADSYSFDNMYFKISHFNRWPKY